MLHGNGPNFATLVGLSWPFQRGSTVYDIQVSAPAGFSLIMSVRQASQQGTSPIYIVIQLIPGLHVSEFVCLPDFHNFSFIIVDYIDGLAQDCSNSSALVMELLQSCSKISIYGLENNFAKIHLPNWHFTCPRLSGRVIYIEPCFDPPRM